MDTLRNNAVALPASVLQAIRRLIEQANESDVPIVDVTESAARIAASLPEASALGLARLSDEIAHMASRDSRVGLSIHRAA